MSLSHAERERWQWEKMDGYWHAGIGLLMADSAYASLLRARAMIDAGARSEMVRYARAVWRHARRLNALTAQRVALAPDSSTHTEDRTP